MAHRSASVTSVDRRNGILVDERLRMALVPADGNPADGWAKNGPSNTQKWPVITGTCRDCFRRSDSIPVPWPGRSGHPLKVETRVRTPLGLQARTRRSALWSCGDGVVEWRLKPRISRKYPARDRA
jgi:hypothetical protein